MKTKSYHAHQQYDYYNKSHSVLIVPEKISKSVIKLHMPSKTINEIYDLDYLELESSSSSSAVSSSSASPVSSSPTSLFSAYSNCSTNPASIHTTNNSSQNTASSSHRKMPQPLSTTQTRLG